jgi:hypothetical protein
MMRLLRRFVPIGSYDGERFVTREGGRRVAGCLAAAACASLLRPAEPMEPEPGPA